MYYSLRNRHYSGWVETLDTRVTAASPFFTAFIGKPVTHVFRYCRQLKFQIYIAQNHTAPLKRFDYETKEA